jgi:heme-degrading monooxygenase HmoA
MTSQCIRVRIKPGKTDEFLSWANSLNGRLDEVKNALRSEGMQAELLMLEKTTDADYVLLYTKSDDLEKANQLFQSSNLKIDNEAKQVMANTWDMESITMVECLLEVLTVNP